MYRFCRKIYQRPALLNTIIYLPQNIETTGAEKVSQIRNRRKGKLQFSRIQAELDLIVRIDEEQSPIAENQIRLAHKPFKCFNCDSSSPYRHQFARAGITFSRQSDEAFVQNFGQKMDERKMRKNPVPTDLLMPSKRHMPGRKRDEDDSVPIQIARNSRQEQSLIV